MPLNVRYDDIDSISINGFDPLYLTEGGQAASLLEEAQRRDILNILRSYTGTFDVFSEAIQNALDAIDICREARGKEYQGKINIKIDMRESQITVIDNGIGMSKKEFLYAFRPNISFKERGSQRGHKGVGATFLAYGFTSTRISTKQYDKRYAAVLRAGRSWAESYSDAIPKPRFDAYDFDVPELETAPSGTAISITIGNSQDERPNLNWINIADAGTWLKVLKVKTPLGGIYLETNKHHPQIHIEVVSQTGEISSVTDSYCEFLFPHEFSSVNKAETLTDTKERLSKVKGGPREKLKALKISEKNLNALWEIWKSDDLLSDRWNFNDNLEESEKSLINKHNVTVYGCFMHSRTLWQTIQKNEFEVRPQIKLLEGGLQIASDGMAQGDLLQIPLTTAAGYGANAYVIVHFTDGNPDMGRKVFQPELKMLAEKLATRTVAEFRKAQIALQQDTGGRGRRPTQGLHEWKVNQERHREKNPLELRIGNKEIQIISEPQEEQDVIALFHQLCGAGLIKGIRFYCTEGNEVYDGLYYTIFNDDECYYDSERQPLGVSHEIEKGKRSDPCVLEYKFDFDALARDFENEIKSAKDINLVVCWCAGGSYKRSLSLAPLLVGTEGATRYTYAATHTASLHAENMPLFEVIILQDLIYYLIDPESEAVRQKTSYM